MNDERERRYLTYITDAISLIESRTSMGREAFLADVDMQDAVLWRLDTLAEATTKRSQSLKERHPDIQLRAIYGSRNIAAHGYLNLNLERVWEIIAQQLPSLKDAVVFELGQA